MDKNIKYILILIFIILWIAGMMIGYKQGKKKALQNQVTMDDIIPQKTSEEKKEEYSLLNPKPILYHLTETSFVPSVYKTKIESLKEDITIINEKGDEMKPSQSDVLAFQAFQFSIFDYDIKSEEDLKKEIKFFPEEKLKEEHYQGLDEKRETAN